MLVRQLKQCQIIVEATLRGSGLRLNDGPSVKLSSMGWCPMLVFCWAHHGSTGFRLLVMSNHSRELKKRTQDEKTEEEPSKKRKTGTTS